MTITIKELPGLVEALPPLLYLEADQLPEGHSARGVMREAADTLESLAAENTRLNKECERAWASYRLAQQQAMNNGAALDKCRKDAREALGGSEG